MEIIEQLGAVNVAAELGQGGLVQVSVEQVLRWNPDVVVTIDPKFYAAARSHPLWRGVTRDQSGTDVSRAQRAVRLDRLSALDQPADRPALARAHPVSSGVSRRTCGPIVRDFYTRCYHQTPSEAQLDELLRTALPA